MKKNLLLSVVISIILLSCGGNGMKQQQLSMLKQKRDALNEKIAKLEKEVQASDTTQQVKFINVGVTQINLQPFDHYVEVQGKLDGDEIVNLSPKMAGVIITKYANAGDNVKKDQVLAKIDDAVFQDQKQALQVNLNLVTDIYNKQKTLWDQKIGSEVQFLQAKAGKDGLEKQLATLNEQIDMCLIKSPIDGIIEESSIKVGQMASPALPVPAYRIVNFNKLKVTAEIAEGYAIKVNENDKVTIWFPDLNKEVIGIINFASKYINPTNRTFTVEVKIPGESNGLKANMIAVLKINDYHVNNALTLPVNLVQTDSKGYYVFIAVKEGDKINAKRVSITEGQSYNGLMEIISGLKAGDMVISTGYQTLEDGELVKL